MGNDPKTSVVDKELPVHGHRNCFVVSSAAWPTVGTAKTRQPGPDRDRLFVGEAARVEQSADA
jgi:hypothetical protein